jgi:branched-chain amino acid transport system substrate-binding protein
VAATNSSAATSKKAFILLTILTLAVLAIFSISCGSSDENNGGSEETTTGGDTTGITDTSIQVGSIIPTSGLAAIYGGGFGAGMQAYFSYVNDQGGIYGRKIELTIEDSAGSAPTATEDARYLIDKVHVFAVLGDMGDEVDSALKQLLDENNVLDLFLLAGAKEFVEPAQPTRYVAQPTYELEGKVWGTYIAQNYDGKKIGILAQNDATGKEMEQGAKDEIDALGANVETTTEYYDASVTDVTSQCQRLKAANIDGLFFFGTALPAASMIKTVRETLSWDVPMAMNESAGAQLLAPLAGAPNMDGMVSMTIADLPSSEKTPFYNEWKPVFDKYANNPPPGAWDALGPTGLLVAQTFVGILKMVGPDLTRENFMKAADSICKYQVDSSQPPQSTSPTDHSLVEAMILTKASLDSSVKEGIVFTPFGDFTSFESTPDCTPWKMPAGAKDQPGPDLGVY